VEKNERSVASSRIARLESGGFGASSLGESKGGRGGDKAIRGGSTAPKRESVVIPPPPLRIDQIAETVMKKETSRWKTVFDESSGHNYYHDEKTNETTWDKPDDL